MTESSPGVLVRSIDPADFATNKRDTALAVVRAEKLRGTITERGVPGGRKKPVKRVRVLLESEYFVVMLSVWATEIPSPK